MKHNLFRAALVLLRAGAVHSKGPSSAIGGTQQEGAFDAMVEAAKAKEFARLSGHSSNGEAGGPSPSPSTFGAALFARVCEETPSSENVLLSPISVYRALALLRDGATVGSQNEAEIEGLLNPPSSLEGTSDGGEDDAVLLNIATSVWANELDEGYVETAEKNHSADALPMPSRYTEIDEWIEEKSEGMLKGFLGDDKIPDDIVALLVSVVYFKGRWTTEFDPDLTADGDFILRDGSAAPARFMSATRKMGYIPSEPALGKASAVILDYGNKTPANDEEEEKPTDFASLFILPETPDEDSMKAAVEGLVSQPISELMDIAPSGKTWIADVELHLPRFKLDFGPASIAAALEKMGMEDAFDWSVTKKFEEMSNDPSLTVDDVLHGAAIEVTEAGTEAAAATAVPMRSRSARRPPPKMTFDRPFVTAVVHRPSGEIVFVGRVEDPQLIF